MRTSHLNEDIHYKRRHYDYRRNCKAHVTRMKGTRLPKQLQLKSRMVEEILTDVQRGGVSKKSKRNKLSIGLNSNNEEYGGDEPCSIL